MSNPVGRWLQTRLGAKYPVLLRGLDGAVTTFLIVFGTSLLASDVFNVSNLLNLAIYEKAAIAGLAAALSLLKSALMTLLTGQTALLGLTSRQLRADRERPPIKHPLPVRPNSTRARRRATQRRSRRPAGTPNTAGAHEAPETDST